MFWAYAAAGGLGLLLGLRYRVPAVLAASAAFALLSIAIAPFAGWSPWATLAVALGGAFTLQCGYLAGLMMMCAAARARLWPRLIRRHLLGYAALLPGIRARTR